MAAWLEAPAQSATCARRRRFVGEQAAPKIAISFAGPDLAQGLLRGVTECVVLIAALRKRRDAAGQGAAVGGDIHDRPRPAAHRPRRTAVAAFETHARLGSCARGTESDA